MSVRNNRYNHARLNPGRVVYLTKPARKLIFRGDEIGVGGLTSIGPVLVIASMPWSNDGPESNGLLLYIVAKEGLCYIIAPLDFEDDFWEA